MEAESIIASTTQFQTLLIAFVLIVAVIYFFIEIRRLDMKVTVLETNLKKMTNNMKSVGNSSLSKEETNPVVENTSMEQAIQMDELIKQDLDIEQPDIRGGDNQVSQRDTNVLETAEPTSDEIVQSLPQNVVEVSEDAVEVSEEVVDLPQNVVDLPQNVADLPENPIESVLSFSLGQTDIINSISEEIANATETMMNQPSEITIITANENPVSINNGETTIEEITETPVVTPDVENEDDSVTMERIDDITEEEVNDKISIDDPILESDNEQPLLTEITAYTEYQNHTIKELKDILTDMNLPTSGNKTKLIQRIVSNKNKISN
jgi:hypothetical protein